MAIYETTEGELLMDEEEFSVFKSNVANVLINHPRSTFANVDPKQLAALVLAHFHDIRLAKQVLA